MEFPLTAPCPQGVDGDMSGQPTKEPADEEPTDEEPTKPVDEDDV